MTGKFTGWHMTAILVGFFAVVIAVNVAMAAFATTTFGGALAKNGYVASKDYARWERESAAQRELGWSATPRIEGGHLVVATAGVRDARVMVVAEHPLGREPSRTIAMAAAAPGRARSAEPMPAGRWRLRIVLAQGGDQARFVAEVTA